MFVVSANFLFVLIGSLGPRISARVRGLFYVLIKTQKFKANRNKLDHQIMKKHFLITLLLIAFAMAATAQNKKIAILETVDKKGDVPYGILLQLRGNLTYAISNTPGYVGYERVDMAQILGEHDFQRTGMVNEEQIRRLGEMTGCSSILVAEAAVYDKDNIIITAKILNVETASVEKAVPPLIASTNPKEMQEACVEVAEKLLVKTQETVEEPIVEPVVEKILITKGKDFYGKDYYCLGEQRLTDKQYIELIKNCPEAWYVYEKGRKQKKAIGNALLISGISAIVIGTGLIFYGGFAHFENDYKVLLSGEIVAPVGGIIILAGAIPIKCAGNHKQKNTYKIYNQYCAQPQATLSFSPTVNGIGVCLSF